MYLDLIKSWIVFLAIQRIGADCVKPFYFIVQCATTCFWFCDNKKFVPQKQFLPIGVTRQSVFVDCWELENY